MKKILGLDLGVSSIGWAFVDEEENKILGMGSRIIPLTTDDKDEFTKGNAISKNQKRTLKRTQRKGYDRYQLRRHNLIATLRQNNMLPDDGLVKLPKHDLWKIRSDAVNKKISLQEIGRILLHLNQKRGYKSSRSEANMEKKDTEYVQEVKNRYGKLKESGLTIGQKFYNELTNNEHYRIKEQVYPRDAYIEEFDSIMKNQQKFYPEILTNELINKIRNEIIYYQRNLKSQKGLVSICEFEGFWTKLQTNGTEKELFVGPRVAPKSSPLFQVCKIWETINNIFLKRKNGEDFEIPLDKKHELFEYMDKHDKLSYTELLKILDLKKDEVYGNKQLVNGLPGNKTKTAIMNCFDDAESYKNLFNFEMIIKEYDEEGFLVDKSTGEVIGAKKKKQILPEIETQPFYKLWHTVYSINDKDECKNALMKKFGIPEETAAKLSSLDFTKQSFGNKSHRAMRKILPYLVDGDKYSDACSYAGYNHSSTLTKQENYERRLLDKLKPIEKNSLRQPVVEKILNQMVNVVNAVIDKYGKPDEMRIELARELKQSKDERNSTSINIIANETINNEITKRLNELGINANKKNIEKYKLIFPIRAVIKKDGKIDPPKLKNAMVFNQCIYCGQSFSLTSAIVGNDFDVDHIIPQALLFDDSSQNKVLVHRACNSTKLNKTAYDFMRSKSKEQLEDYLDRLNNWYEKGILSYAKLGRLKVSHEDYLERKSKKKDTEADKKLWENFIDRQLRETQYISKKAREILQSICYNVWATSGNVTAELRHIWGWDDVLVNLQLPKYRELGLTETIEIKEYGNSRKKEIIKGWTKRDDHRHHAIDALTIACTKQGYIQRFNTLNSSKVRNDMLKEIEEAKNAYDKNKNLLENYIYSKKPFSTKEVEKEAEKILVSFKAGKKVASLGKRKIKKDGKKVVVQNNIIVPRGPLSEESVYGKINIKKQQPIKYLFENPHLIFKPYIKTLVEERLYMHNGDLKSAVASLRKEPIYLDKEKTIELKYGTCYQEEIVIKYPLGAGQGMLFDGKEDEKKAIKVLESVVDKSVRDKIKKRLFDIDGSYIKTKEALKDLENNPIWFNEEKRIPIKTVRCLTGLTAIETVKKDTNGKEIGFVKPGNNHHLAIYLDEFGSKQLKICTFWHAVERKKYGLPVIIKNPVEVIDMILAEEDEEQYPDSFLEKLPDGKWTFLESFQQNEMYILGINNEAFDKAIARNDYAFLSNYLYKLRSIAGEPQLDLYFEHHLETEKNKTPEAKLAKRYILIKSIGALDDLNPIKVRINYLSEIVNGLK